MTNHQFKLLMEGIWRLAEVFERIEKTLFLMEKSQRMRKVTSAKADGPNLQDVRGDGE
jgi:hypothetical protein